MSATTSPSVNPNATLTIEYTDAQGQVQRTEKLQGAHFTLRVHENALAFANADANSNPLDASTTAPTALQVSPPTSPAYSQRVQPWTWALLLFGIFALLTTVQLWIEHNPDNTTQNLVTFALGITAGIAAWAAVWALLGKIFAKHASYWQHVCLVLISAIALSLLTAAMHFASFSLSWRMLGRMDTLIGVAALALLAWAHLSLIVPAQKRPGLRIGMIGMLLASVALMMWTNHRKQGTVLDTLHTPHLYRPSLQLSSPQSSSAFFEQAKSLETSLKAKAGETEPGEDSMGGDED